MPANEETLNVSSDQTRVNFVEKVCNNGLQNNLGSVCPDDDEEDCQNGCPGSVMKKKSNEHCNYKSLPVREIHEKFMRSFVDLLLEEALFMVSSLLLVIRKSKLFVKSLLSSY